MLQQVPGRRSIRMTNLNLPIRKRTTFVLLICAMTALFAVCWPTERSFDLWVFKDRGSFLELDYLLDRGLRLGVDSFYIYGLLPVLIQRVLFLAFGRGAGPLMACHAMYVLLSAAAWTLILDALSKPRLWLIAVMSLTAIVVWVNPNLPAALVQVSLLFSVALLLRRQYRMAIAVSAVGCWSVPTLTLLASALLVGAAVFVWLGSADRSIRSLVKVLWPGALCYVGIGAVLVGVFGPRSVLATALPLQGAAVYAAIHYGFTTTLMAFLHPATFLNDSPLRYYLFDRATWWMLGTALLVGLTVYGAVSMPRQRRVDPRYLALIFCVIIHVVFALFAYGSPPQHVIYDPLIVVGVIVGLDLMPANGLRATLLAVFLAAGVLGQLNQLAYNYFLWRTTQPSTRSAGFYAPAAFVDQWSEIVALSLQQPTLVLSYSSGLKHYFPSVDNADVWTVQVGEIFENERQGLLEKLRRSDVIAEDLTGPTELFDSDPDVKAELARLCLTERNASFVIWKRVPAPCGASAAKPE
jgi:hypothetical protein